LAYKLSLYAARGARLAQNRLLNPIIKHNWRNCNLLYWWPLFTALFSKLLLAAEQRAVGIIIVAVLLQTV